MVPPYVIKNDTITSIGQFQQKAIPLNCIFTTSTDAKFNKAVFYKLEEALACFCSRYWNISAKKSIRFFQEAWRDNFKDVGSKHKDLYAHLSDVPTLVISPILKNGRLIFRFYWWGLSIDSADAHLNDIANELDSGFVITSNSGHCYSDETVEAILAVCIDKLEAFISFFADMYYWNFYRIGPTLPTLLSQSYVRLSTDEVKEYFVEYESSLRKAVESNVEFCDLKTNWSDFAPAISDKENAVNLLLGYIETLPESKQIKELSLIKDIREFANNHHTHTHIDYLIRNIQANILRERENGINWAVHKSTELSILYIIQTCLNALKVLPSCDSFHLIKKDTKLAVAAFFTKDNEIVSWGKNGVWLFLAPKFYCPKNLFSGDRFSCPVESLNKIEQIIIANMNKEDVSAILDSQYQYLQKELRPLASKIDDLFKDYINNVKEAILHECEAKEVESLNRKELKYEDIVQWLRKAKTQMGELSFNGAFLCKSRSGLFDKYPYKMYMCLTKDKQPLINSNHPKCVISFMETDDTLDDMFGSNDSMQLNFK